MQPTATRQRESTRRDDRLSSIVRDPMLDGWLSDVSIVIPVAAGDDSWRALLPDLAGVAGDAQLILVGSDPEPSDFRRTAEHARLGCELEWVTTGAGRARQMNFAAACSRRRFLWFLHADSRLGAGALGVLEMSLHAQPEALHYFDLAFQADGPWLTRYNALGARCRSRWLGLPFGDQGLAIKRETFDAVGGFDATVKYGEDHMFVWATRRKRVPLCRVAATIATSARRYRANGWLPTTLGCGWRTWRQAAPQACRWLWSRCR